jgi:hypothetical protein
MEGMIMDSERFDGLVRRFGQPRSRRQTLRGLAGAVTAGALGLGGGRVGLANHKPSHCAHEGEKVEPGNSGKGCCEGEGLVVGADGRCVVSSGCADAVLAGAGGSGSPFLVDDDLEVFVNDASVFVDNNENAGNIQPIPLGSLANGDDLRVVASDSATSCGGATDLAPITLYCLSTGTSQVIIPNRIQGSGLPCGAVFFDQTFEVAL